MLKAARVSQKKQAAPIAQRISLDTQCYEIQYGRQCVVRVNGTKFLAQMYHKRVVNFGGCGVSIAMRVLLLTDLTDVTVLRHP